MIVQWQVKVFDNKQLVYTTDVDGPLELGRQSEKELPNPSEAARSAERLPYVARKEADRWRIVIARLDESAISRHHLQIDPVSTGRAMLKNVGRSFPIQFPDGSELRPGGTREMPLPLVLAIGKRTVRIQAVESQESESSPLQSLMESTRAPGWQAPVASSLLTILPPHANSEIESLVPWFQAAMSVLQSAAATTDFFPKAARAVVDLVGMDSGRVLLRTQDSWRVQAVESRNPIQDNWRPSGRILNKLLEAKRTFWDVPTSTEAEHSLVDVKAVVAAPILDRNGAVIGALYGDRRHGGHATKPISRLEAMLVELLATGVAAGLARIEQEQAALTARVQFEQFFTPELTRQLAAHPDLLEGRDAEVSILFADIRGFSRVSGRLGPAGTFEWIGDVMGELSESVLSHQGVLVDYIGDELMAMWGAPEAQPQHALLACRAALDMLQRIPRINARWEARLGEKMGLGIGINTGTARVGNTGSQRKFKYGPLGPTVNLASRVEGATKYLKTRFLVTEATRARLDASFTARRLCQVRVVHIIQPVTLFELRPSDSSDALQFQTNYERALVAFESGLFREATTTLGKHLEEFPDDGPALVLMARAVNALVEDPNPFNSVWDLPGK
ncbi:MAG: adenylate/guanylate cyclase domain-containing protein [Gemmataceae bacterium]|nr:adenylate/guanylate cyclase domain-containing protein [Gemmataceae bacterium]